MKAAILTALALVTGVAAAQTDTATPLLTAQFNRWRGLDDSPSDFRVEMAGADEYGANATPFRVVAYHHREPGLHQILITEYETVGNSEREVGRIVGDGKWLWSFDPIRREFTAAPYATEDGLPDNVIETKMLSLASVVARGNTAWPVRLMKEVFGGDTALYRSWQPSSTLDTTQTDPTYRIGDPMQPKRELRWALDPNDEQTVLSAAFFDIGTIRNAQRRTSWTMSFDTQWAPNDIPTFAPLAPATYRTWKAVPWARQAPAQN